MLNDNNAIYLITAYVVFIGGMLLYLLSLKLRLRNVQRDAQEIDDENN
jgi:hypothetical protein